MIFLTVSAIFLLEFDSHKGAVDALSGSGQNLTICIIVRPNGTTCISGYGLIKFDVGTDNGVKLNKKSTDH